MTNWELITTHVAQETGEEDILVKQVIDAFTEMYHTYFDDEMLVNHHLPIEVRAFRQTDIWWVLLLLTPWMLARVFLPQQAPKDIKIPDDWQAEVRKQATFTVIGPAVNLAILGGRERAHLNYHPRLGHYLIQPLIQSMSQFNQPEEAFEAWNQVIRTRNQVIEQQKKQCDWHQEVSRREFFAKLRQRADLKK